jgi:DNA primase
MLTPEEIKARLYFAAFFRNELGEIRPGSNGDALALCPWHDDTEPSLSVNL